MIGENFFWEILSTGGFLLSCLNSAVLEKCKYTLKSVQVHILNGLRHLIIIYYIFSMDILISPKWLGDAVSFCHKYLMQLMQMWNVVSEIVVIFSKVVQKQI